jgi:hypothetical protein
MIDRVSDVLARLPVRDLTDPGGELDKLRRREAARAVLGAILLPTDSMVGVGNERRYSSVDFDASRIWTAMIKEALK